MFIYPNSFLFFHISHPTSLSGKYFGSIFKIYVCNLTTSYQFCINLPGSNHYQTIIIASALVFLLPRCPIQKDSAKISCPSSVHNLFIFLINLRVQLKSLEWSVSSNTIHSSPLWSHCHTLSLIPLILHWLSSGYLNIRGLLGPTLSVYPAVSITRNTLLQYSCITHSLTMKNFLK